MKSLLPLVFLFTCFTGFSQDFPDLYHGFSLGNVSLYTDSKGEEIQLELFSYRILDGVTGLGMTTYIWPVFTDTDIEDDDVELGVNDLFALEFNWEPFITSGSFWGTGLYFRIDNYLPGGNEYTWRTGARIDIRLEFEKIIYPLVTLETGYWSDRGLYLGVKLDPVVIIAMIGIVIGQTEKEDYIRNNNPEEYYPNGEPREDRDTIQQWMLEAPEP